MALTLSITNHRSDIVGLKYIYPVLSRRAGGLSIGINFNTNNACNWRCIYCQVPDLITGSAPALDFALLEQELRGFLQQVLHGDFYDVFQVPPEQRVIKDIAIAGNGEPTSLKEFAEAVGLIGRIATELGVFPESKFVLISNGSLIHLPKVQDGLRALHRYGGEVWFKLDSADDSRRKLINNSVQSTAAALANMRIASGLCTTKIQTCVFEYQQQGWSLSEQQAYLDALNSIKNDTAIEQVMLYTLARTSAQPEASGLEKCSAADLEALADKVRALGFSVSVSL
jgi:wyosine [tRNA(Phe)-imidazoG37] synthetase (radical SAM superfamily)